MIKRVELKGPATVIVENNEEKEETIMGIENYLIMFTTLKEVYDFIDLLDKAVEFWEYKKEQ